MTPPPASLRHVAVAVRDLPRALEFYTKVLGFQSYHTGDRDWAMLCRGSSTLSLIVHAEPGAPGAPRGAHPSHFGLTVETSHAVDAWHAHLERHRTAGLTGPKRHRDGSYGFYAKDTEGNTLEVIFIPLVPLTSADPQLGDLLVAPAGVSLDGLLAKLALNAPNRRFALAYREGTPSVEEAAKALLADGRVRRVRVLPILTEAPGAVEVLRAAHPAILFEPLPPVGDSALVESVLSVLA